MGNLQLSPGSLFANRFEIQGTAGSGGMATVYRATDRYSGDTVALKLLHAGGGGPDEAERFAREAHILAELRHPGIVAHVAHGQTPDGQRFLAMEWLEGQDLGHRLTRGPLPVRDCLRLIEQVADALSLAHQRGIIHRDMKPSNLFLCAGDIARVKILDFGIARRITTSQAMTKTGMVVGTPEYMAPEQARGSRDLTPATDLFSLGCVLYECLTGQPPFVADHIAAVLVQILFEEPIPIEVRLPGVSQSLSALMAQLLTKDPARRMADASALRTALVGLGELPEPALAATIVSPRPKVDSFAEQEQSLYSIVLAAPTEEGMGLGATRPGSQTQLADTDRRELLQALSALGSVPDFLANETLVVTVPSLGSAQDQATLAARAALLVKERWPEAVVSMATGRGSVRGRSAVGEVVDLAARSLKNGSQQSLEKPTTGVLIDPLSAKLLEGRFTQTPRPGGALLLHEEKDVDASRPLLGKPTPCVGREPELANLEAQLADCIAESEARVVLVTAPPGTGKSRLRHEFLRRVETRNESITILLGRGDMMSAGAPFGILAAAIRKVCGVSGSEPISDQRRSLRARMIQHLPFAEQDRIVVFIGELVGIPFPTEENALLLSARQEPRVMHERIRRAFLDWLAAELQAAPILLILDDLQWGDILTVSLLDEAMKELRNEPLFVLALGRPEVREVFPKLWSSHMLQEVALKGLGKKASERLVQQVMGKQVPAEVVAHIVGQAAGNALYLEELIRAAAENKLEQPETVLVMLQARIGRFDSGQRQAVRAASVFGQTFWQGGVATLLGFDPQADEVERRLAALVDAEVIEVHKESRLPKERQYAFRHALIRDAAYGLLSEENRTAWHRLAGEYLSQAGETNARVLAEHFCLGAMPEQAAAYYTVAAEHQVANNDLEGALATTEQGLACGASGRAILGGLRACQSSIHLWRADLEAVQRNAGEALDLLEPGSLGWCRCIGNMFLALLLTNQQEKLAALVDMFAHIPPAAEALTDYLEAGSKLVLSLTVVGSRSLAAAITMRMQQVCNQATSLPSASARGWVSYGMGFYSYLLTANPFGARVIAQQAVTLFEEAGDRRMIATGRAPVGALQAELGDLEAAVESLRTGLVLLEPLQENLIFAYVAMHLSLLLAEHGDVEQLDEAVAVAQQILGLVSESTLYAGTAYCALAHVHRRRNNFPSAETAMRKAREILRTAPGLSLPGFVGAIEILLQQGRSSEAFKVAEEGLQLLETLGCGGHMEVQLRTAISRAFYAVGHIDRAHAALREALHQVQIRAENAPDSTAKVRYLTRAPACVQARQLAEQWGLDIVIL